MTRDITGGVACGLRLMVIIAMGTENREADEGIEGRMVGTKGRGNCQN